jgi:hypothetical protein
VRRLDLVLQRAISSHSFCIWSSSIGSASFALISL